MTAPSKAAPVRLGDGLWATAVAWWLLVALLRTNAAVSVHPYVLLAAQVAPVALVTVHLALTRPGRPDPGARRVALSAGVLVGLCAVSTLWSLDPARTALQAVVAGIAFAFVTATLLWAWPGRLALHVTVIWALGSIVTLAGVLGRLVGIDITVGIAGRSQGFVGNPNYFGMLLTTTTWAAMWLLLRGGGSKAWRLLLQASIGLALGALFTTGSRGSVLALATGLVVLVVLGRRRVLPGLATLGVVAAVAAVVIGTWLVAPDPHTRAGGSGEGGDVGALVNREEVDTDVTSGRLGVWKDSLSLTLERPVQGHGYRTSEVALDGLGTHNLPLAISLELGLLGLLATGWLGWCLVAAGRRRGRLDVVLAAAAAALVVQELLESTLHAPSGPVALLQLVLLFALAASTDALNEDAEDSRHRPNGATSTP
ncbi:O-antigen ligase family protein [Microvirga sp. 0TCS3.31]